MGLAIDLHDAGAAAGAVVIAEPMGMDAAVGAEFVVGRASESAGRVAVVDAHRATLHFTRQHDRVRGCDGAGDGRGGRGSQTGGRADSGPDQAAAAYGKDAAGPAVAGRASAD